MAIAGTIEARSISGFELGRTDIAPLLFAAVLPVALFVATNATAEYFGLYPLFFAPFGLPGWLGGALHIGSLPFFGLGAGLAWRAGGIGRSAALWSVVLIIGMVAFPFVVAPLDSLMLTLASMTLLLVGLAAATRAFQASPLAGLVMLPGLVWIGLSAFLGLSFVATWAPPFGLTHSTQPAV